MASSTRREFLAASSAAALSALTPAAAPANETFQLQYMLASSMYGYTKLAELLPEVAKTGATALDIWAKVHGDQREQAAALGVERFAELLAEHQVKLGCITQYPLGPFGLAEELTFAQRLGCQTIVTGAKGPKGLTGDALKAAVKDFVTQMNPHLAAAEAAGVTIAIENHGGSLLDSPEAIRWFSEFRTSERLGLALAPSHLPQDAALLAGLIRDVAPMLRVFYAWQRGNGFLSKLPKEEEMLQLPGRGPLDFAPLLAELRRAGYQGWTEVFMHPTPRGIPIRPTVPEVTAEINRSRAYLAHCLGE